MDDDDRLIYAAAGPLAALALGIVLVPLREMSIASNFTLAFLALTIFVGEFGGRIPAVATAVVSALSLDFFLTRPYLHLAMRDKDDVVAFLGLAGCGLLASFLGTPRREREFLRRRIDLVFRALRIVERAGPVGERIQEIAETVVGTLPLAALFVRDDDGGVIAGYGARGLACREPADVASAVALATARPWDWRRSGAPLPAAGLRLPLVAGGRSLGWLDLWGDGRPAGTDDRQTIAAVADVLAAVLETAACDQEDVDPPAWSGVGRPATW